MQDCFSELTDSQWQLIEKVLNDQRQRWHSLRTITNAILSVVWSGVQWRNLDSAYPPWQSVYYHYRKWKRSGLFERLLRTLVVAERRRQGRNDTPSRLAFDSQSVKIAPFLNQDKGWDGAKCINGRKRHLGVDSLGLPWAILVTSAQVSDSAAGCYLADRIAQQVPDVKLILADHGYKQSFLDHVARRQPTWRVEIVPQRRTAEARIDPGVCAPKRPLASRTVFRLAEFSPPTEQRF
jgi:transposase